VNRDEQTQPLTGVVVEEDMELTLGQLCRASGMPAEQLFALVEEGLIEPMGRDPACWRFRAVSVRRVLCAQRLRRDLGVNAAGAALALDLLEEIEHLRGRLRRLGE
jgi:chaperone modulatory protein CbpM